MVSVKQIILRFSFKVFFLSFLHSHKTSIDMFKENKYLNKQITQYIIYTIYLLLDECSLDLCFMYLLYPNNFPFLYNA